MPDLIHQRLQTINILGAAVVISGIAVSAFGLTSLYAKGRDCMYHAVTLRNQLSQLDGLSSTLDQVEYARRQTEARLAEVESRLPTSNAMDQFLHELSQVAERAGLQVDSTDPGKEVQDAAGYLSKPVSISGVGDWDACYKFLTGLRKMNRLTRLDSLSLESDTTAAGAHAAAGSLEHPLCRMSVTISTFIAR